MQGDTVEKCRELSIELLSTAAEKLLDPSPLLSQVLPAMAVRIGNLPIVETSEEIRLQLVKLLGGALMKRCQPSSLNGVMKEILAVLVYSCNDAFHEIIKASSATIVALTTAMPKGKLHSSYTIMRGSRGSELHSLTWDFVAWTLQRCWRSTQDSC